MKRTHFQLPSFERLAIAQALIIILTTIIYLPVAFATPSDTTPRTKLAAAPLAGTIQVNVSNDADNLDPNSGCDTDAAASGEQCSLRAAVQRANALAGDDEITFNIPSTQPNCDPSVNRCTINLFKPLPDLSTNIRIVSPGFGNLAPGQWATTVVIFSGANNPSGAKRTLTFAGTNTGGTFNDKWKVSLP